MIDSADEYSAAVMAGMAPGMATVSGLRTTVTMTADELADLIAAQWDNVFLWGEAHQSEPSREHAERLRSAYRKAARRTGRKVSTFAYAVDGEWLVVALWRDAPEPTPEEKRRCDRMLQVVINDFMSGASTPGSTDV